MKRRNTAWQIGELFGLVTIVIPAGGLLLMFGFAVINAGFSVATKAIGIPFTLAVCALVLGIVCLRKHNESKRKKVINGDALLARNNAETEAARLKYTRTRR